MHPETFGVLVERWGAQRQELDWALGPSAQNASSVASAKAREADSSRGNEAVVPEPPDALLIEKISKGEREAFAILFRRYARMVRRVAERILHNSAEADDLVQEVFLFVFQKAHLFDPTRGSARSWLVQVTYHRAIDRRRSLACRGFYTQLELEEGIEGATVFATGCSYDDTLEATLGPDAIRRIEGCLSQVQRRVLDLRFADGCTIEEIASILGQSVGNVRNHYYRALEKIRKQVFGRKAGAQTRGTSG